MKNPKAKNPVLIVYFKGTGETDSQAKRRVDFLDRVSRKQKKTKAHVMRDALDLLVASML